MALLGFAGSVPGAGDGFVIGEVGRGSRAERLDQLERVTNARKPRHRFGISRRPRVRVRLRKDVQHCPGLTGTGLTND